MTTGHRPLRPARPRAPLWRETGFALAALAVWMLLLLSPLHQSAQALVVFQRAGVLPPDAALLCRPAGPQDDKDRPALTCPFQGLHAVSILPPLSQGPGLSRRRCILLRAPRPVPSRPRRARHALPQPRAPPVLSP